MTRTGLADRVERIRCLLRESDLEATPESLVVRNVKEYLLLREYRERKLERAKASAREALAEEKTSGPS